MHPLNTLTEAIKVAGCIHWTICNDMGLQVTRKYYEHIPEKVINVSGAAVMWDVLQTEKRSRYKDLGIEVSRRWKVRKKNCASYNWSVRND